METYYYHSPIGLIKIFSNEGKISQIDFVENHYFESQKNPRLDMPVLMQLDEYFKGRRHIFDLKLDMSKGTKFQQTVWEQLKSISYGETISYKNLAQQIGNEKSTRAVASACKANPIPIVVACHRVIKDNGELGGYNGGVRIKEWLLEHEKKHCIA